MTMASLTATRDVTEAAQGWERAVDDLRDLLRTVREVSCKFIHITILSKHTFMVCVL